MPQIGRLRQRITLQTSDDTAVDDHREPTIVYTELVADLPASVEPLRGREFFAVEETQSEVSHRVMIRYSTTVAVLKPKDRVLLGTRAFDIQSVINREERNRWLELMCVERI